jgi:hypothetical protein
MHGAEGFLLESFRSIAICLNAGSPTITNETVEKAPEQISL